MRCHHHTSVNFGDFFIASLIYLFAGVSILRSEISHPVGFNKNDDVRIIGLWQFDGGMEDSTGSWSAFGRSSRGRIAYDEARVGKGAYSAVHGEDSHTDWHHHATGRIRFANHAVLDGEEAFGIALWVRPVAIWARNGRIISFGPDAFGIANVPGEEGRFRLVNPGFAREGDLSHLDLPMDEWSHVAITADGGKVRVLLNGVVVGEVPPSLRK